MLNLVVIGVQSIVPTILRLNDFLYSLLNSKNQKYINTYVHYRCMPFRDGVTTIQISPVTRDKLKRLGAKGDTYDDIIQSLLKNQKK